jgi:branched-chain amino acid transport system ATP-binding protein
VLALERVTAGYGDLSAIRDVSLKVCPGEVVALFGPNGAGKTTTLRAAVGRLAPVAGQVFWRGHPRSAPLHRLARGGLSYIPEERSVISDLSTRDNLKLGRGGVDGALRHFPELEPLLRRRAGLLSGGEQQMLTLARALAAEPRALLVDELSLGLAPLMVGRLLTAIRDAADRGGLAVLLVEQQARRALSVADRWYLVNNGGIIAEGSAGNSAEFEAAYFAGMSGTKSALTTEKMSQPTGQVDSISTEQLLIVRRRPRRVEPHRRLPATSGDSTSRDRRRHQHLRRAAGVGFVRGAVPSHDRGRSRHPPPRHGDAGNCFP